MMSQHAGYKFRKVTAAGDLFEVRCGNRKNECSPSVIIFFLTAFFRKAIYNAARFFVCL